MADDHTYAKPSEINTPGPSVALEIQCDDEGSYPDDRLLQNEAASNAYELDASMDKLSANEDSTSHGAGNFDDEEAIRFLQEDFEAHNVKRANQLEEDAASNAILFRSEFENSFNPKILKNKNNVASKVAESINNDENMRNVKTEEPCASNAKTETEALKFKIKDQAVIKDKKDENPSELCVFRLVGETHAKTPETKNNDETQSEIYHNNNDNTSDYNVLSLTLSADGLITERKQDEREFPLTNHLKENEKSMMLSMYSNAKSIATKWLTINPCNTAAEFAAYNNMIRYKPRSVYVFCKICATKIQYALEDMERHVLSRKHLMTYAQKESHKVNSYANVIVPARQYIPFQMPMIDFVWDTSWFSLRRDIVVNKTFCLRNESYHLVRKVSSTHMLCYVCNDKKTFDNLVIHITVSLKHEVAMNLSLVLTELKSEFVREVFDHQFHCGFCNLVIPSLRDLQDHMRGLSHQKLKLQAYKRLHKYMPLSGQQDAISAMAQGQAIDPSWSGRKPPGLY